MNRSAARGVRSAGVLLLLVLGLSGCVGYRLGSMLPKEIRSVYIPTFVNETQEPLIERDTTDAAIREFQKDGTLQVAGSPETADTVLTVTLTGYELSPISYDTARRTTANEYRITLTAAAVLTSRATGQVVAEAAKVQGESTFDVASDMTTMKRQNLPKAAADLAHGLVETVVEAWQ
ncbi:MAG: LptE family protein [Verrucomicrobiota bacterium]